MPERAALITGGSSGIGLAIARMLGKDLGYALTVNGRRPDKLEDAVAKLKDEGIEVTAAPGNMADEVVGLSQSAHRELAGDGIQVTAFCPGFVDTPMTDWTAGSVPKEDMIQPEDIAEGVRFLLASSPACFVPEIQFIRAGDVM
jgi:NAD(P)-dependent dehydrogenase (short-subunit alcohol dehydrogenase family)